MDPCLQGRRLSWSGCEGSTEALGETRQEAQSSVLVRTALAQSVSQSPWGHRLDAGGRWGAFGG